MERAAFVISICAFVTGLITTIINLMNYKVNNSPSLNWSSCLKAVDSNLSINYNAEVNLTIEMENPEKIQMLIFIYQQDNEVHTSKLLVNNKETSIELKIPFNHCGKYKHTRLSVFGKSYSNVYFIIEKIGGDDEFAWFKGKTTYCFYFEPKALKYKRLLRKATDNNNTYIKRKGKTNEEIRVKTEEVALSDDINKKQVLMDEIDKLSISRDEVRY
ncbi:hypothetical protein ACJYYY_02160 [Brochothrix campestris]|uniref:hypothetical protein n=1 Tax=Brochothrix campestris TaxID=2757 RepID=UPI0038D116FD